MSTNDMNTMVKELRELRRMAEEVEAEITAIQDALKGEMTTQGTDTLTGSDWRITWKSVTSSRLDSAALKKELPDVAARYMRQTTARWFVLA